MTRQLAIIAALVLTLWPATAQAVTPTAPLEGAVIASSYPLYTWTLDGHIVDTVSVSRAARTTPDGEFFTDDVETGGLPGSDASTSWQGTRAMPAGAYWWSTSWHAPDYSTTGRTTPIGFTIPARVEAPRVRVSTVYPFAVYADTSWWSNTRTVRVVVEAWRGSTRVGRRVEQVTYPGVAKRSSSSIRVGLSRAARGGRVSVRVAVTGGGVTARASSTVRIPTS